MPRKTDCRFRAENLFSDRDKRYLFHIRKNIKNKDQRVDILDKILKIKTSVLTDSF